MEEHAKVWPSQQSRGATEVRLQTDCSFGPRNGLPTSLAQQLAEELPGTRFLLPTAPPGPHGLNSWYETEKTGHLDGRIYELRQQLLAFVQSYCNRLGLQMAQVAFLGFSQGSMLAALLALELPKPCAGLVVLNGGMPWDLEVTDALGNTRILFVSGGCDRTVTVETTRMAKERLLELGAQHLEYLEIPDLKHEISSEVICLAADFFSQVLTYRVEIEGCIQIPKGTKVILRSAFEDCLAWSDANTATVESFVCSDEKYWIRLGEECQLLDAKGFTQQLPVQLGGSHAWVAGSSIAADGGLEWLLLAQQDAVEVKRLAPHRVQLPLGSVLRLGGLKSCAQRLRGLEGRRARLRQVLPDGRYAVEVEGEEALVRLHPRHLVP
ncbi:Probable carboxylesterase SOBER1-like [Durusdinium trenchii]|uniref:Probable carboxylesterase SOBER1-like n=1 Tax=Durusdinium trenchii TaxID=1381693 RepID=A0ABP0R3I4_9DINO